MTKRKIAIHISLILCVIVLFSVLSGSVPTHTTDFYVNDYANVLSEETESEIMSTAIGLENETTAQVVVLTVENLNGKDISDFSVETFRNWGIGDKKANNGVLIVLSVDDREMWITTGYGVEGTLTDTRLGQLRDIYAIPYYGNDDFNTGTILLFNAIVNELRTEEYGLEPLSDFDENGEYYEPVNQPAELPDGAFVVLICFWLIPFILFPGVKTFQLIKYLKLRSLDKRNGTNEAEKYRKRIKNKRETTNYRGGGFHGGFGGGGGGGFGGGGFSGGGGSTGGGGAGGRF